ncbi:hypothetical protein EXIGLDRAFT_750357 [Exidia glandulosa HHB12029]|uniref:Uncharacterized protein n=1 Tax=Exidia glandulosa HHB12029 TaxID=1314781 RepID=A0A165GSG0_EXIGL|nr:hypothetical protein EXIGLDRAFT_750357 [Exidia glandulosa HHB12029]
MALIGASFGTVEIPVQLNLRQLGVHDRRYSTVHPRTVPHAHRPFTASARLCDDLNTLYTPSHILSYAPRPLSDRCCRNREGGVHEHFPGFLQQQWTRIRDTVGRQRNFASKRPTRSATHSNFRYRTYDRRWTQARVQRTVLRVCASALRPVYVRTVRSVRLPSTTQSSPSKPATTQDSRGTTEERASEEFGAVLQRPRAARYLPSSRASE